MGKLWFVLVAVAMLVACIPPGPPLQPVTAAQQAWYDHRDAQPPDFMVPAADGDQGWSRAKAWITRCSDFKLQVVDPEVLQTYNPPDEIQVRFGYSVSREKQTNGDWRFNVRAMSGNSQAGQIAYRMAQDLAVYILTGEDCPGCPCGTRRPQQ